MELVLLGGVVALLIVLGTMHPPLERAAEMYRRQRLLEETNRAFAALRANPGAWRIEQAERQAWDMTLADGLIATRRYRPRG